MKIRNTEVFNFANAFRGTRNPLESWNKSDSFFGFINFEYDSYDIDFVIDSWIRYELSNRELKENEEAIEEGSREWEDLRDKYYQWWLETSGLKYVCDETAEVFCIGPNDLKLAQKLILSGPEHCKFMRQIFVSVDLTAPIYW